MITKKCFEDYGVNDIGDRRDSYIDMELAGHGCRPTMLDYEKTDSSTPLCSAQNDSCSLKANCHFSSPLRGQLSTLGTSNFSSCCFSLRAKRILNLGTSYLFLFV